MTVNPFDLKSAPLAKHAQHVVLVHFPIALFISSFVFDLLAIWTGSRSLARAAYYNLIGAAITALADGQPNGPMTPHDPLSAQAGAE